MKNLLNIEDQVKVVLQGEGKENVIGNGEIVTVTNIDKFPDGTIYYIGSFHVNCPEGGEGYDTTIQFKEGEYSKLDSKAGPGLSSELTVDNLEKCFYEASHKGAKYVGVKIQMQGFPKPEIIINENENFDSKVAYYKKAYNDNLILKSFEGVKIVGFTYGDSFEAIEHDLMEA